ncbi:MAG: aspartate aminotransferase family protein [Oscillospiraceae bacterium]|nr:aspartate aminotransferase family protein [Oscillospiraceae bacterium]
MNRETIQDALRYDMLAPIHAASTLHFVRGEGASYFTEDGKEYVDLNEIRLVLGQNNREFNQAMVDALGDITTMRGENRAKAELLHYLNETTRGHFAAVHLTSSGTESAENAVRLARKLTGRTEIISFWNSIHGRGILSGSMSGVPRRKAHHGPLAAGLVHFPYPNCAKCPLRKAWGSCDMGCLELAKDIYASASAQDAAAVVVELCQAAGVVLPPPGYMKALQNWAREQGMLFIVDEVQSGMGRTGEMYLYQKEGLEPDILLLGKALGNGQHISAMLVREVPEKEDLYIYAGGSGDDPVACRAACEVFRQLENGLLEHIRGIGEVLVEGLKKLERSPLVKVARGVGLSGAVEFYDAAVCAQVGAAVVERGFLPGYGGTTLFCKPPYVVTREQIQAFLQVMEEILTELE